MSTGKVHDVTILDTAPLEPDSIVTMDRAYLDFTRPYVIHRSLTGRQRLRKLLSANKRLQTAYLLKESFGQLCGYRREGWARRFLDHWKESLKWQRIKSFEKFAAMVERNWEGIAEYCRLEEKTPLGFVEGVNTKIRVIQRRRTDSGTKSTFD